MIHTKRLDDAIDAKGWTFREFSRRTGMSDSSRRNWTSSRVKNGVRSDILIRMCQELEVSADWLLGLSDEGGPKDSYWDTAPYALVGMDVAGVELAESF